MSIAELIKWNIKSADRLSKQASVALFKDTASELLQRAQMHRATAKALAEK